MKVKITRDQVALMYQELCNDNLKETFELEGEEVVEAESEVAAPTEEVAPESTDVGSESTQPETPADAPADEVAPETPAAPTE